MRGVLKGSWFNIEALSKEKSVVLSGQFWQMARPGIFQYPLVHDLFILVSNYLHDLFS